MNRRALLQHLGIVLGTAASTSLSRAVLAGVSAGVAPVARVFDPGQAATVASLAELFIPATDSPGAIAAGVPEFIESIVASWYNEQERQQFFAGLGDIDGYCQQQFNNGFNDCDQQQQSACLAWAEAKHSFFATLRELVVLGYFTSEVGATQALAYNPMPMRYDGAYPLAKVGRQWSS